MVKVSYHQEPYRRITMDLRLRGDGLPQPQRPHPHRSGSAGSRPQQPRLAGAGHTCTREADAGASVSKAVEVAATSGGAKKYSLGSVLGHVLMHQTVVGQEALQQMEMAGEYPDLVIGCAGGGSNFAGFAYPFLHQNLTAGKTSKTRT